MTWPARECSNLMTNHRFLPAATTFLVGFVEDTNDDAKASRGTHSYDATLHCNGMTVSCFFHSIIMINYYYICVIINGSGLSCYPI